MIISTFPNNENAKNIINTLLVERLIACANIVPGIQSYYWWDNKIQEETEVIVFFKTRKEFEVKVIEKIASLHPYKVPAIYAIESTKDILPSYLEWINNETHM